MNNFDELLFSEKLKKIKVKNNSRDTGATYRKTDVSEYMDFKKNMKRYRKRLFGLIKVLMQSNDEVHTHTDEYPELTTMFLQFANESFQHFNNLEKMKDVNDRFNLLSKLDKVMLSNNSS